MDDALFIFLIKLCCFDLFFSKIFWLIDSSIVFLFFLLVEVLIVFSFLTSFLINLFMQFIFGLILLLIFLWNFAIFWITSFFLLRSVEIIFFSSGLNFLGFSDKSFTNIFINESSLTFLLKILIPDSLKDFTSLSFSLSLSLLFFTFIFSPFFSFCKRRLFSSHFLKISKGVIVFIFSLFEAWVMEVE